MEELTLYVITEQRPGRDILIGVFTDEAVARRVRRRFASAGATIRTDSIMLDTVLATPPSVDEQDWRVLIQVTKTAGGFDISLVNKDKVGVEDVEGQIPLDLQTPLWRKISSQTARAHIGASGVSDATLYAKLLPIVEASITNNELPTLEI